MLDLGWCPGNGNVVTVGVLANGLHCHHHCLAITVLSLGGGAQQAPLSNLLPTTILEKTSCQVRGCLLTFQGGRGWLSAKQG
jgi:hypothetical protein